MMRIHDRMPAIIAPEDYPQWLDPSAGDQATIARMLAPYPAELMRAYAVGTRVNSVKNEGAELLEPVNGGSPPSEGP
jgi:putative SOS response-associated peptidase YedK